MNTRKILSATLIAAAFAVTYLPAERISAQTLYGLYGKASSPPIQMEVAGDTTGIRQRTSQFGIMDPIGVLPGEQIGINLIVASNRVNYPVGIVSLDGGEIIAPANLYVTSNGTNGAVGFTFKGGNTRGLFRVLVSIGSERYQLQLIVAQSRFNCPPPP